MLTRDGKREIVSHNKALVKSVEYLNSPQSTKGLPLSLMPGWPSVRSRCWQLVDRILVYQHERHAAAWA